MEDKGVERMKANNSFENIDYEVKERNWANSYRREVVSKGR